MIFAIIAVNIFTYARTIQYHLVMDDFQWYRRRMKDGFSPLSSIKNISSLHAWIQERLYSGTTFGTNKNVERCVTIALHTLTCVLMFFVFGSNEVSMCAALLYAVNPINNQTSIWLNGRRYSINIVLVLTMMLFPISSLFLYPFTLALQVTAIFSPLLIAERFPAILILVPAVILCVRKQIMGKIEQRASVMADGDLKTWKWTRIIVIVKTFGFFFWKMIFPGVCAMQYPDRINWGKNREGCDEAYRIDTAFIKGVAALGVCGVMFYYLGNNYRFCLVFMVLAILQWSAVIPVTQILSDRYASLPNVFMMFFLSYVAHAFLGHIFYLVVVPLFAYYALCLSELFPMYYNIPSWYTYHFRHFPGLSWLRSNLVSDLMNEGNFKEAYLQTLEGLMHDKKDFSLLMWAAILHAREGKFKESDEFIAEAENNFYLNKENDQAKEISDLRANIEKLKVRFKKNEKYTRREIEAMKARVSMNK